MSPIDGLTRRYVSNIYNTVANLWYLKRAILRWMERGRRKKAYHPVKSQRWRKITFSFVFDKMTITMLYKMRITHVVSRVFFIRIIMRKHARRRSLVRARRFIVCAWLPPTSVSVFDDEKRPFREDFGHRRRAVIPPPLAPYHTKAAAEILELVSLSFRPCACVSVPVCVREL